MNLKELVSQKRIDRGLWWGRAWSLIEGCSYVSEACQNCWAAAQAHMRSFQSNPAIIKRYGGLTDLKGKWKGKIKYLDDNLELPLKIKKPTLWAIWNDLFHENVSCNFIEHAFQQMAKAKQHFFLILTKRPEIMWQALRSWKAFPNVGLGVTVELPKYLHRIEILLQIPAALHFVSLEPLLGDLSLKEHLPQYCCNGEDCACKGMPMYPALDWVILGCESGRHRRETRFSWVSRLVEECKDAFVPVFIKQLQDPPAAIYSKVVHAPSFNGGKMLNFPEVEWSS